MAQTYQPLRTVRVVAAHGNRNKENRTINIVTSMALDPSQSLRRYLQAAGNNDTTVETVIYSGGTNVAGLATIFIAGFVAPA